MGSRMHRIPFVTLSRTLVVVKLVFPGYAEVEVGVGVEVSVEGDSKYLLIVRSSTYPAGSGQYAAQHPSARTVAIQQTVQ